MTRNMLKLNMEKIEFIVYSFKQHTKKTENHRIKVRSSYINYSMFVRNLGLILDNTLGTKKDVNIIFNSCYYQIRNIELISKYINDKISKHLVQVPILSTTGL